jgi:hypothetical protein
LRSASSHVAHLGLTVVDHIFRCGHHLAGANPGVHREEAWLERYPDQKENGSVHLETFPETARKLAR